MHVIYEVLFFFREEPAQKKFPFIRCNNFCFVIAMSDDVKMVPESSCPEFEDLSPDSRMECKEELDRKIAALVEKREAVLKIMESDPMDRTLLVVGARPHMIPTLEDFKQSFKEMQARRDTKDRRERYEGTGFPTITGFEVFHEENCKFQNGQWLKVKECFIVLRSIKDARFLLEFKDFFLNVSGVISRVTFARHPHDDATRKTYTFIGGRVERLEVVKKELSKFETVGDGTTLSGKYMDIEDFNKLTHGWKLVRSKGLSLSDRDFSMLQSYVPVPLKEFKENFKKLWDERTDLYLELQTYRAQRFEFEF